MADVRQQEQYAEIERILKAANHYQVLGVQKEIEDEELKRVYKKLALLLHPDKVRLTNESDRPRAEQAFRGVQVAYETLKAPHTRKSYDLQLRMGKTTFVPGESMDDGTEMSPEDEDAISPMQFILTLGNILLAVLVYVAVQAAEESRHILTPRALLLQCCLSGFIFSWLVFQVAVWKAGLSVLAIYAFNKLIPPQLSLKYFVAALIFQIQSWNTKQGVPGFVALGLTIDCLARLEFSFLGALGMGFMVLGTLFMGLLFERVFITASYTFALSLVLVFTMVYQFSWDVFLAVFVGLLSWSFLQGIPAICLFLIVLVLLYLAYCLSVFFLILVLSTALVFIGERSQLILYTCAPSIIGLSLAYYGWQNTLLVCLAVGGARFAVSGWPGGKRTILACGLVWCLDCSYASGSVVAAMIWIAGWVLSKANMDPDPEGDMPRRRRSDVPPAEPGAGAAKGASKKKKKK